MNKMLLISFLSIGLLTPVYAAEQPKMTPEQEKMMAEMQKMATPNENHKVLDAMAGNWTFVSKMRMKAGDKQEESKGTLQAAWVYGNRFLKREFQIEWAGNKMTGTGIIGYDNALGEYQDLWFGDMDTSMMLAKGTYDAATKTLRLSGTMSCSTTGEKNKLMRTEVYIPNSDTFTYTMFDKGPDGKEFKMVVETYKRVK